MVVGIYEELQVGLELVMGVVVIALDRGVLDGPVHALNLAIGPGVVHLCEAVLDPMLLAHTIEDMGAVPDVLLASGELDAIIGQHDVDAVRHSLNQVAQELSRLHLARALHKTNEGELACAVDGHEEAQLALSGLHLGNVDMEVADGVRGEALPLGLVALHLGQAADAMPLKAAVQSGSREMGDRRLKPVETVIQRQQRMPSEGDNDRLLLRAQDS